MNKYINIWLFSACILIITMVVIGGITRLTHSGLSMVQWKPVSGSIPPLNETDWQVEFDHYKQYPEYKLINNKMTLDEFKSIFFWEYIHRMIGRFLGLLFVIPFCIFYYKKMIPDKLYPNLFIKRFFLVEENRWVSIKVSASGIRLIDKKGLKTALEEAKEKGFIKNY